MNRALQIGKLTVYAALFVFLCALTQAASELRVDVHALTPKISAALDSVRSIARSTSDVEQATYATEGQVANLADSLNEIAQGLSSHEESELRQAQDASAKVSMLIDQADVDLMAFGLTEQATTSAINGFASDSHAALGAAQAAINQAALQVSNPAIAESLSDIRDSAANVKDSTTQVSLATQQLSAAAVDARQVADHWKATALAPVSTVRRIAYLCATLAGKVFGL
jgi:hypothetical protein